MLEIYIMTDESPTCTRCYSRAEILVEFVMDNFGTQLCKCNNNDYGFMFLEQQDDYFNLEYWMKENHKKSNCLK